MCLVFAAATGYKNKYYCNDPQLKAQQITDNKVSRQDEQKQQVLIAVCSNEIDEQQHMEIS